MTIELIPKWLEWLPFERVHLFCGILLVVLLLTLLAVLLDLRDGIYTARMLGQHIHSHVLRKTIAKIIEYWQFVFLAFLGDICGSFFGFYSLPYLTLLFGVSVIIIEGKSMLEHARRRKSRAAKLPETLRDIAEFVGGTDELRSLLAEFARRQLDKSDTAKENINIETTDL